MTPEEILVECKEFTILKGTENDEKPTFLFEENPGFKKNVACCIVESLAQSRKEARELREQNQHLQGQLNYFTGGLVDS